MITVLNCLVVDHNLWLVGLAGLLCAASCTASVILVAWARRTGGTARLIWAASGGMAGGFGIWATHFIAMLAYDPKVIIGYQATLTLASLAISILTTFVAAYCVSWLGNRTAAMMAGTIFGLGVSAMHFVGMTAIEFPGTIVWDRSLVTAAVGLAVLFSVAAFVGSVNARPGRVTLARTAGLMAVGIVSMHFTAMGGVELIARQGAIDPEHLLSPSLMVITIVAVSLSLLFSGIAASSLAIRAEVRAAAGHADFRRLVQGVTEYAIYMLDPEGRVTNWNAGAARAKGYAAHEIVGKSFSLFYTPEERDRGIPQKTLQSALKTGTFEDEAWRVRKDGSRFWAHVVIDTIYDERGQHIGFAKITRDCTERMRDAARLKETSHNLALALNNMANAICLYDADERLVLHNERMREIMSIPADVQLTGRTFRELCEARYEHEIRQNGDAMAFYEEHRQIFSRPEGGEHICRIGNGRTIRTIHSPTGDGAFVTTVEDITARVESDRRIRHLARHDMLTGLPNRRDITERLDNALASAGPDTLIAVICIDLDNFKEVNDTFGHAAGDVVLQLLSKRMLEAVGHDEFVSRLGGDEFVAIKIYTRKEQLTGFLGRLSDALNTRIISGQMDFVSSASLGVSLFPADTRERDRLMGNADRAMYRSKTNIETKISFYEAAMEDAERERRAMARDLWKAMEENQFHLTYQVQKKAHRAEITGYEALLRWRHPVHGLVSPAIFIPIAEECGAISAIGEWVLRTAAREAVAAGLKKVAVNLSPLQLNNPRLPEMVHEILLETGLSPVRLELEVTESAIIGDKGQATHILRQLKAMGIVIAIDDFGTGYSSLETLRAFPFDKIKLDRSFVKDLDSRQSKAFVRAIVALGNSLNVSILAEGVETLQQLQVLAEENCDEVQGFLFGQPMTISELADAEKAPLLKSA